MSETIFPANANCHIGSGLPPFRTALSAIVPWNAPTGKVAVCLSRSTVMPSPGGDNSTEAEKFAKLHSAESDSSGTRISIGMERFGTGCDNSECRPRSTERSNLKIRRTRPFTVHSGGRRFSNSVPGIAFSRGYNGTDTSPLGFVCLVRSICKCNSRRSPGSMTNDFGSIDKQLGFGPH